MPEQSQPRFPPYYSQVGFPGVQSPEQWAVVAAVIPYSGNIAHIHHCNCLLCLLALTLTGHFALVESVVVATHDWGQY